jgi:hypothetical protein
MRREIADFDQAQIFVGAHAAVRTGVLHDEHQAKCNTAEEQRL